MKFTAKLFISVPEFEADSAEDAEEQINKLIDELGDLPDGALEWDSCYYAVEDVDGKNALPHAEEMPE